MKNDEKSREKIKKRKISKDEKPVVNEEEIVSSKKKGKKFFLVSIAVILLVGIISFIYFNIGRNRRILDVVVENEGFHEMKIIWDADKKITNYVILISEREFTREDVDDDLKDGKFDLDYQVIESDDESLIYNMVKADTDYFVAVVPYKVSGSTRRYYEVSKVAKSHTSSLKINGVSDLKTEDMTDTSFKLVWSEYDIIAKNLDGTDIDVSYTIFTLDGDEWIELERDLEETSYSVSKLEPFTKHSYKVVVNATIDGKINNSDANTVLDVVTKPSAVKGLSAKAGGTSSISLKWEVYDKSNLGEEDVITYSVYGSDSKDGEYKLLKENIKESSFIESGLSQGKTRYYYVVTIIEVGDEKYEGMKSQIVSSTTQKQAPVVSSGSTSGNTSNLGSSSSGGTSSSSTPSTGEPTAAEKNAQARVIAKQIAASITGSTDYEKVSKAAQAVSAYYHRGVHKETGNDYYTAYGVFIKGESSCAGTTRALGMVLEEMGYSWKHVNENLWTHQWLTVVMDGQEGWADGQVGLVGFGKHPFEY